MRLWHTEGLEVSRTQGNSTPRFTIVSSCSWESREAEPSTEGKDVDTGEPEPAEIPVWKVLGA